MKEVSGSWQLLLSYQLPQKLKLLENGLTMYVKHIVKEFKGDKHNANMEQMQTKRFERKTSSNPGFNTMLCCQLPQKLKLLGNRPTMYIKLSTNNINFPQFCMNLTTLITIIIAICVLLFSAKHDVRLGQYRMFFDIPFMLQEIRWIMSMLFTRHGITWRRQLPWMSAKLVFTTQKWWAFLSQLGLILCPWFALFFFGFRRCGWWTLVWCW